MKSCVSVTVVGLRDFDWAGWKLDINESFRNVCKIAGGAASQKSKKQTIVAISIATPENVALSSVFMDSLWSEKFNH